MTDVAVRYEGPRATYREGAYGSGLVWAQGETKLVPEALATKLLRHAPVYVPGDKKAAPKRAETIAAQQPPHEDTQEVRDALNAMDKDALEAYARTQFRVELDKRKSVQSLRGQVTQLVDQYGATE
jgi:hypothetical protein